MMMYTIFSIQFKVNYGNKLNEKYFETIDDEQALQF